MKPIYAILVCTLLASTTVTGAYADAKSRRALVEKTTRRLIAQGLITSASDAQIDVTGKLVALPLDSQATIVAGLCQQWTIVAHDDETPDARPTDQDQANEVVAGASCDVTRNNANLMGRTLGDAVRWEPWYLRQKGASK